MRNQLLNDLAEGLKDAVIVDTRQMVEDRGILHTVVAQLILDTLHDVALDIKFVVFGETIDFVYEDFDVDVRVCGLQVQNCGVETGDRFEVVVLRVDYPD